MKLSAPIFRLKRQARLLARETQVPLHVALDQVSRNEGFRAWSHLAAAMSGDSRASGILSRLAPGDLVLLGSRPGHGKTMLGLELAVEAVRVGRQAFFFTLEDNEAVVLDRLCRLGADRNTVGTRLVIDTSDAICAQHIVETVAGVGGAIIVIDYLQLLDQQRRHPELDIQLGVLKSFATRIGAVIVMLSQIDRRFESTGKSRPDLMDIRLPNPVDLAHFNKTCFMHDGEIHLEDLV